MDKWESLYQLKYVRNTICRAGAYGQVNNSDTTGHSNLG